MNLNTVFQEIKFLFGAFVVLAIMFLAGCSSITYYKDTNFDSNGLPNHKYLVGAGLDIQWRSPQAGTVYLVEEKTSRIVITRSLDEDDEFEFNHGSVEEEETKKIFGVNLNELRFSLYFIPTIQD